MSVMTRKGSVAYYKTLKEAKADAAYHRRLGNTAVIRKVKSRQVHKSYDSAGYACYHYYHG